MMGKIRVYPSSRAASRTTLSKLTSIHWAISTRTHLLLKYHNLSFLTPSIDRMTGKEPVDRPLAAEALALFRSDRGRLSSLTLYRRITPVEQNFAIELADEVWHLGRRVTSRRRGV
ncbi:hypothetical protein BOTBODRAFT_222034 [Botryobasidium botryosum FD-172 SS1]|uniref:Uncharacterized protein n=1 Tax=Botryobasidium botryosum (strain FD-172 SS1) TaxID=930990 RepID=A0A067MN73_BOTB1|nr:hypothetical protein BOTBODRAFT_222034 [Botryobasidium botryosum FD-172 SS1]